MGRLLTEKVIVEGNLVVDTALHVGGGEEDLYSDMMLARNGDGDIYLPGSSLAGSMRNWWRRSFGEGSTEEIWGPAGRKKKDSGRASLIRVEDAQLSGEILPEVRDGVAINRGLGTAADGFKYDREIAPKGAQFRFRLILEIPERCENPTEAVNKFASLVKALQKGAIRFGGARTRGLGKVRLIEGRALEVKFTEKNKFLEAFKSHVRGSESAFAELCRKGEEISASNILTINVEWCSVQPVMVKDPREGMIVEMLPLTTGNGDMLQTVLPGAGIKGVIRAHSERIVRTLQHKGAEDQGWKEGDRDGFSDFIVPDRIIENLYGRKGENEDNTQPDTLGISAVAIDDCFPEALTVKREMIEELLTKHAEDKKKSEAVDDILEKHNSKSEFYHQHHNAIDRWTGGAADAALYSVLEPGKSSGVIDITVDLNQIKGRDEKCKLAALALLLLTLWDFKDGLLPIGFGGNRGLGAISVSAVQFEVENAHGFWPQFSGELASLTIPDEMQESWALLVDRLGADNEAAA